MRFFDTRRIIDSNKALIAELYTTRLQDYELRALQEIRTWHLPVKTELKVRAVPEQTLMYPPATQLSPMPCPHCQRTKPVYGERYQACLQCWDLYLRALWGTTHQRGGAAHAQNTAQQTNEPVLATTTAGLHLISNFTDFTQWAHTLLKYVPTPHGTTTDSDRPPTWSSPKKNFLAAEVGCTICGRKAPIDWLWSEDTQDWGDGTCPAHVGQARTSFLWNMHPADYAAHQESYSASRKLQRTAQRYGAASLLLVSSDYAWVKLLSLLLPVAPKVHYIQTGHLSKFTIGEIKNYQPRSLDHV